MKAVFSSVLVGLCLTLLLGSCERYYTSKLEPEQLPLIRGSLYLWLLPRGKTEDYPLMIPGAQPHQTIWMLRAAPKPCDSYPAFVIDSANLFLRSAREGRNYSPVQQVIKRTGTGCFIDLGTFLVPDSLLGEYRLIGSIHYRDFPEGDPKTVTLDVRTRLKTGLEPIYK